MGNLWASRPRLANGSRGGCPTFDHLTEGLPFMIRALIFDIDGTLIDSVDLHAESWQVALRHFGHEIPFERVRAQIGKGGDKLMPALLPSDEVKQRGKEIEQYRLELFRREYLPRVKVFPRVRELFERIRADGKRMALASSAKAQELEQYKRIAG